MLGLNGKGNTLHICVDGMGYPEIYKQQVTKKFARPAAQCVSDLVVKHALQSKQASNQSKQSKPSQGVLGLLFRFKCADPGGCCAVDTIPCAIAALPQRQNHDTKFRVQICIACGPQNLTKMHPECVQNL